MSGRILPFLALMISLGIFFAYINPTWTGPIAATKLAIANDNQALDAAAQYKTRESQLAAARDSIDPSNLARLATLLPDSVNNVGLTLDINALAARSGLALSNVDVATAATSGGASGTASGGTPSLAPDGSVDGAGNPVGSVDLSLSAVGTYAALQTFLTGIEHSARLLDVRDLLVSGSNTGVYTYQMTMRLYWLR